MNIQEQIQQLHNRGMEVRITHLRRVQLGLSEPQQMPAHLARKLGPPIEPNGGMTIVEIYQLFQQEPRRTRLASISYSRVHLNDNFNRKLGVRIALERAVSGIA